MPVWRRVTRSALALASLALGCGHSPQQAPVEALAVGDHALTFEFIGETGLPSGLLFAGTEVGGLSGLVYVPEQDLFLALSDDKSQRARARFYAMRIAVADGRLDPGDVQLEGVTILLDDDGEPFARGAVDPEGIALDAARNLYICSEGGRAVAPFIRRFSRAGETLGSLPVPEHYLADRSGTRGARYNLAFEAVGAVPAGHRFFAAVENALVQDGPAASVDTGSPCRILVYDLGRDEVAAEHLYPLEPVSGNGAHHSGTAMNGLADLLALDEHHLLVLEREWVEGRGTRARIYLVAVAGATDISGVDSLLAADRSTIVPVGKRLVFDLDDLGLTLDNVEGMALGPSLPDGRRALILISDNNFNGSRQFTQVLGLAVGGLPDALAGPGTRLSVTAEAATVAAVQGAAHVSPWLGAQVGGVRGVVVAARPGVETGFWIQDPLGDGDPATSEGLLVVPRERDLDISVGDLVRVAGTVAELGTPPELGVTAIVDAEVVDSSGGHVPPPATLLGGGSEHIPPAGPWVDDDALAVFEPSRDAIDFFESLEGMRVRLEDPVVVGPTSRHGEFVVVADGVDASGWCSARGARVAGGGAHDPQLIVVAGSAGRDVPQVAVGDRLPGGVVGVLDYTYGSFKVVATEPLPEPVDRGLEAETTTLLAGPRYLTVASFNVQNLSTRSTDEKLAGLGSIIASRLGSPDILALQEVQDDSGDADDGTVMCAETLARLKAAIVAAGGPGYASRYIDPEDGRDGGRSGSNIRVVLLFNPERVDFIDRGRAGPNDAVEVGEDGRPSLSPGRIAPLEPAFAGTTDLGFEGTRKPLVAEFGFCGQRVVVVNNHLSSKRLDDPLFGRRQPPRAWSEEQRIRQASAVHDFVSALLVADPASRVIVLGDFNDTCSSQTLGVLAGDVLRNLTEQLPPEERYTYVYRGSAQALDHILVSPALEPGAEYDVVHVNAEFPVTERASDHDPVVARFAF